MENNKLILIGLLSLVVSICSCNNTSSDKSTEQQSAASIESVLPNEKPEAKTQTEQLLENAEKVKDFANDTRKEFRDEKIRNDSARKANRKSKWVYQIGLGTSNSKDLLTEYNQLKHITNIKIFRHSKKSYFLYKDDGYTEQQLKDSLNSFQAKISETGSKIEIIDLMDLCTLKENIVSGEDIKVKKADVVLLCNTCD